MVFVKNIPNHALIDIRKNECYNNIECKKHAVLMMMDLKKHSKLLIIKNFYINLIIMEYEVCLLNLSHIYHIENNTCKGRLPTPLTECSKIGL